MTASGRTLAHGTLDENGDTWFLMRASPMIPLNVHFVVGGSLRHKTVSDICTMGILPAFLGLTSSLPIGSCLVGASQSG
jgi:hypothetical protein